MKFVVDSHTHTLASGHAYSTIIENAQAAKEKGLKLLCTTDHAPEMPGAPHYWFFNNQKVLPRFLHDVGILRGVEANIMNTDGELDLHVTTYPHLDWIIASFHEPVFPPSTPEVHTQALINIIKSGKADVLGHLGNPNFPFDIRAVMECAKEHHVAIEINNTSLTGKSRKGSEERCSQIVEIGKEVGVSFTTGSDAHFCNDIACLNLSQGLFEKHGVAEDQIISTSTSRFLNFLLKRGRDRIEEFAELY
ncbi:phosphatase [Vibrio maerlii]|uniref:phosphatase n=1 Tax=Vibrio maerlii TaxID=2231648 RepID=UPI000E3C1795|nr:phosphatase [Vibrio maerlii]